ncbi:H-NS family nucleoid-associated regulatory protein [Gallaecimonas kandeliae]|uniref:H-NS histone family protein n=1 Tax=Gallaecimonas kandeliae TaxID=3029055 RepID=UPI002647B7A8|nr:H-NS family nucleoid-associated regulatory protein [Gallaecimonas kandeliae]WKE66826.1 H-NS family nucleoid-associated regulatory protein [Gallaecimonas kandeliae]
MSDFLQILGNQRRLNAATKELSLQELEEIKGKLEAIIEMRAGEEEERQKEEAERLAKIDELRKAMAEAGISAEDILGGATAAPSRRGGKGAKRAPKYRLEKDGEEILWTGIGRMPKVFKEIVDNGGNLDNYLIK